jgi:transketolase
LPPWREGELRGRWQANGWHVIEVDGHSIDDLVEAFAEAASSENRPSVLLAQTVKGKGVSFMEDRFFWHTRIPTEGELGQALSELGERS